MPDKHVIAMVLVGGRGSRLGLITKHTAKPAVTFGGKYKIIDFVLSNLSHAQIDTVGIVTQYEPHELMRYIQRGSSWDLDVTDGGIHFLTPYTSYKGEKWQKGTAHAIQQHLHFMREYNPTHVLILSGDHLYKMHYQTMISAHESSNADLTIGMFTPPDSLSRYGVIKTDEQMNIVSFQEKPKQPKGSHASMGVYLFKTSVLEAVLQGDLKDANDFGNDIIPKTLDSDYCVKGFQFDGYFRDVGTVESLFQANMDLIDHPESLKLHDYKTLPLYTKSQDLPPHHIASTAPVHESLISDGSLILGRVEHSVISSNVLIKTDAYIENSLVFSHVKIGENSHIKNCIILENTVILPRTKLVFDEVTVIDNDLLWSMGGVDYA